MLMYILVGKVLTLDWTTGIDYQTGIDYWTDMFLVFTHVKLIRGP